MNKQQMKDVVAKNFAVNNRLLCDGIDCQIECPISKGCKINADHKQINKYVKESLDMNFKKETTVSKKKQPPIQEEFKLHKFLTTAQESVKFLESDLLISALLKTGKFKMEYSIKKGSYTDTHFFEFSISSTATIGDLKLESIYLKDSDEVIIESRTFTVSDKNLPTEEEFRQQIIKFVFDNVHVAIMKVFSKQSDKKAKEEKDKIYQTIREYELLKMDAVTCGRGFMLRHPGMW
jgi:hypothetical protein